jgi:hypothetical protein
MWSSSRGPRALAATEISAEVGDVFAAKTGFDPRQLTSAYLYFRIHLWRVQAWREENELENRDLMRDGRRTEAAAVHCWNIK